MTNDPLERIEAGASPAPVRHEPRRHDLEDMFRFIVAFKRAHDGNSPTLREIGAACGIPTTSVTAYNLQRLESMGRIHLGQDKSSARRIHVVGGVWTWPSPPAPPA